MPIWEKGCYKTVRFCNSPVLSHHRTYGSVYGGFKKE